MNDKILLEAREYLEALEARKLALLYVHCDAEVEWAVEKELAITKQAMYDTRRFMSSVRDFARQVKYIAEGFDV